MSTKEQIQDLPYSNKAETAVLGALLLNPDKLMDVSNIISPEAFFVHRHRWVFEAMIYLHRNNEPIDYLTVSDLLKRQSKLEDIGGDSYLTKLINNVPTSLHAEAYARLIKRDFVRRKSFEAANGIAKIAGKELNTSELISKVQKIIERDILPFSSNGNTPSTWEDQAEILPTVSWLWNRWLPIGLPTMVVGAPEVGKSILALMIVRSVITGSCWPDGSFPDGEGLVVWYDTENAEAINHERSQAWGIPREKVLVPSLHNDPLSDVNLLTSEGWAAFETAVRTPGVRLVVVDSLGGAYLRENDPDVKFLIKKLGQLARDLQVALIIVHHPRKLQLGEYNIITLDRVRGHSGIIQFARVIWAVERPDPLTPDKARCKVIKSNLGRKPESFGFEILDEGIVWTDAPHEPKQETQRDKAADLLKTLLKTGPVPATEIYSEAEGAGISKATVTRAKKALGIGAYRKNNRWEWSFQSQREPEPYIPK